MIITGDRVLVLLEQEKDTTESGIYLPANTQEKSLQGIVTSVGLGIKDTDILVGDAILFQDNCGTQVKINGDPHLIIKEQNILAIISQEETKL